MILSKYIILLKIKFDLEICTYYNIICNINYIWRNLDEAAKRS